MLSRHPAEFISVTSMPGVSIEVHWLLLELLNAALGWLASCNLSELEAFLLVNR